MPVPPVPDLSPGASLDEGEGLQREVAPVDRESELEVGTPMLARERLNAAPTPARQLQWMAATARQEQAAFADLFDFYAPRIKSFLIRTGTTAGLAEELAQETLLVVWRKASAFDPQRAAVSTWIFTIARNLRIDQFRRDRTPEAAFLDPTELPDDPAMPDDIVLADQRAAQVQQALATLTAEQLQIVKMSFFESQPHSDIARSLGIPLGTAKSRIRRTLAHLRGLLEHLHD